MSEFEWLDAPCAALSEEARQAAYARQGVLTKPPGALGRMESLAIALAAMQGQVHPTLEQIQITIFAADHGIATKGVSAFPQAVTAEMVKNFAHGGAAISVLAKALGAELDVVNLGTVVETGELPGVSNHSLGAGTACFSRETAMSTQQLAEALAIGRECAQRAHENKMNLFIGGEMGIGNTSSASALACVLLDKSAEQLAGPGTGLDQEKLAHKVAVLNEALQFHAKQIATPLDGLQYFGGFEIAALVGAYIRCAQLGVTVLVDGFIASVAALMAVRLSPDVNPWFIYSHASAEPGHQFVMNALDAKPLLDLDMRLGEASGAAVCVPLLRLACSLHNGMATFEQAGVSKKE